MLSIGCIIFGAVLFFGTPDSVNGYANPVACLGDCALHDPSVMRRTSDGKYFRCTTTTGAVVPVVFVHLQVKQLLQMPSTCVGETSRANTLNGRRPNNPRNSMEQDPFAQFSTHDGIKIATANSLRGTWTNVGSVMPSGKSIIDHAGNTDPWAPDVSKIGDLYYCYYSIYDAPHQSVTGVASSATMEPGTWTDHGEVFRTTINDNYSAIDANAIQVSGTLYVVFGSYWNDIHVYEMETPLKTKGSPIQLSYNATAPHAEEGSNLYYHSGYFYLFFSAGQCCGFATLPAAGLEYRIAVCRSQTVTGKYLDASGKACLQSGGTTVLASHDKVYAPGGQGVLSTSEGDILYYHYINTDLGYGDDKKPLGWNVITWVNGWPTV